MTKINITITLIIICFSSYSQTNKNSTEELKDFFFTIPDSTLKDNIFNFAYSDRLLFWRLYTNKDYENVRSGDKVIGDVDKMINNDSILADAKIDKEFFFLRIRNKKSDAVPTCDIKVYKNKHSDIIGVSIRYYDFASYSPEVIVYYKIEDVEYIDITDEILNSFNYFTDNFDDTTINILSHYYSRDLHTVKFNDILLYSFTKTDTVYISNSFFDIPVGDLLDNDKHFDGEFYTKKYIMENGKLMLAE